MKALAAIVVLTVISAACDSKDANESRDYIGVASAPSSRQDESAKERYLAYEHTIVAEIDEDALKPIYDKLVATCTDDKEIACTVLDASINSGRYLSATLRLRAKPAGIKKLASIISEGGMVSSQATHVEDLAKPVTDVARRLAMLQEFREKLLQLQRRPNNDADSLIKIAEKLAAVQADLERATGERAHLLARVNLEILNVSLSTRTTRSFWSPIVDSLREFPANLSSAIGTAIAGLAYVLPWLFIVLGAILAGRIAWRRFRSR